MIYGMLWTRMYCIGARDGLVRVHCLGSDVCHDIDVIDQFGVETLTSEDRRSFNRLQLNFCLGHVRLRVRLRLRVHLRKGGHKPQSRYERMTIAELRSLTIV